VPLNKVNLTQALQDLFEGKPLSGGKPAHPQTATAAGDRWATAYADYATGATAGPTAPTAGLIPAAKIPLASALATAFQAGADTNVPAIAAMDTAFVAFWTGMTFVGPGVTGVVSLVPPPPSLTGALSAAFQAGVAHPAPSAAAQASKIADAFNTWTTSVMVLNTVTVGGATSTVPLA
jgi:hypothetical protein